MPQISVLVPVYNVEPFLRRCVDSILAQTFQDFEVILVDDGSPDNCGVICDEYAVKDARVHVIHQANGGRSAARNACIDWAFQKSDSRWLAFVDSDDWVHPQYLELLYNAAVENNVKLSCCEIEMLQDDQPAPPMPAMVEIIDWEALLMAHPVFVVSPCNKLYAKELFDSMRYPLGRDHEDEYLTYKLIYRARKIASFSTCLYYYYHNPDGIINSSFSQRRLDSLPALEERLSFTRQNGGRQLFLHDLKRYLYFCKLDAELLQRADAVPPSVRAREVRSIRSRVRAALLRYCTLYRSPWKYRSYFAFAFPALGALPKAIYHIFKPPSDQIAP